MIQFRNIRQKITPSLRFQVLRRDGFRCWYCGATAKDERLQIDHIKPVARGGTNHPSNLVTACVRCNIGKGINSAEPGGIRFEPSPTTWAEWSDYGWGWWAADDGDYVFAIEFDGVEPAL